MQCVSGCVDGAATDASPSSALLLTASHPHDPSAAAVRADGSPGVSAPPAAPAAAAPTPDPSDERPPSAPPVVADADDAAPEVVDASFSSEAAALGALSDPDGTRPSSVTPRPVRLGGQAAVAAAAGRAVGAMAGLQSDSDGDDHGRTAAPLPSTPTAAAAVNARPRVPGRMTRTIGIRDRLLAVVVVDGVEVAPPFGVVCGYVAFKELSPEMTVIGMEIGIDRRELVAGTEVACDAIASFEACDAAPPLNSAVPFRIPLSMFGFACRAPDSAIRPRAPRATVISDEGAPPGTSVARRAGAAGEGDDLVVSLSSPLSGRCAECADGVVCDVHAPVPPPMLRGVRSAAKDKPKAAPLSIIPTPSSVVAAAAAADRDAVAMAATTSAAAAAVEAAVAAAITAAESGGAAGAPASPTVVVPAVLPNPPAVADVPSCASPEGAPGASAAIYASAVPAPDSPCAAATMPAGAADLSGAPGEAVVSAAGALDSTAGAAAMDATLEATAAAHSAGDGAASGSGAAAGGGAADGADGSVEKEAVDDCDRLVDDGDTVDDELSGAPEGRSRNSSPITARGSRAARVLSALARVVGAPAAHSPSDAVVGPAPDSEPPRPLFSGPAPSPAARAAPSPSGSPVHSSPPQPLYAPPSNPGAAGRAAPAGAPPPLYPHPPPPSLVEGPHEAIGAPPEPLEHVTTVTGLVPAITPSYPPGIVGVAVEYGIVLTIAVYYRGAHRRFVKRMPITFIRPPAPEGVDPLNAPPLPPHDPLRRAFVEVDDDPYAAWADVVGTDDFEILAAAPPPPAVPPPRPVPIPSWKGEPVPEEVVFPRGAPPESESDDGEHDSDTPRCVGASLGVPANEMPPVGRSPGSAGGAAISRQNSFASASSAVHLPDHKGHSAPPSAPGSHVPVLVPPAVGRPRRTPRVRRPARPYRQHPLRDAANLFDPSSGDDGCPPMPVPQASVGGDSLQPLDAVNDAALVDLV